MAPPTSSLSLTPDAHGLQKSTMLAPNVQLPRKMDLSYNNFTGPVPAFLAKSSVPSPALLMMSLLVRCIVKSSIKALQYRRLHSACPASQASQQHLDDLGCKYADNTSSVQQVSSLPLLTLLTLRRCTLVTVTHCLSFCLQGNRLTADCGNSSYVYLDICDKLLNGSDSGVASAPTPTPAEATMAPTGVVSPAVATPPADAGASSERSVYLLPIVVHYAAWRCKTVG